MTGNVVLMVTKIRNVAAPKVKEDSGAAPRMLKISLTDGLMTCHAVELTECRGVSIKTPPGTKIKLKGNKLDVANGFIKVSDKNLEVLGGEVEALVEKWKVSQQLAEFTRSGMTGSGGDGPPKWIPFGQKNKMPKQDPSNKDFKALGNSKDEEEKEGGEFESQRQEAVQEALKGEQKKFGAGNKNIKDSRTKRDEERAKRAEREKSDSVEKSVEGVNEDVDRGGSGRGRGGRGRGRGRGRRGEREDTEGAAAPSKPSLFDFLQGQIPNSPSQPAPAKEDTKTVVEKVKPKPESSTSSKYSKESSNSRDSKDARGGKKDLDRSKSSNSQNNFKRDGGDRKGPSDKKDYYSDKKKDDDRKKDNKDDKRSDRKDARGDRSSQNKEFHPVFHGKNSDKDHQKLDKYERSLFAEESKNKGTKSDSGNNKQQNKSQRENSKTDFSSNNKYQNGYNQSDNRRHHGNDQDFGQWNGSNKRQHSNLSKEDQLSNGLQEMHIGGRGQPSQRGGHHQNQSRGYNQNNGYQHNRDYQDQRVTKNYSDRRTGGHAEDRGQRHQGRGGGHHQHQGGYRQNWHEGQKCKAKYWEVSDIVKYLKYYA